MAILVGTGRTMPAFENISANLGMTKVRSTKKATTRATVTMIGYCKADLMSALILASCSMI